MNITPLHIYLWQLSDQLIGLFGVLAIASTFVGVFAFMYSMNKHNEFEPEAIKPYVKTLKMSVWVFVSSLALCVLTPSSKTIALMYVIPGLANSTVIQRDVPELYDMAVKALKEQLSTEKK